MNEYFGPAALRLSGIAARLLGWPPDDFWSATPAELTAALTPPGATAPAGLDRAGLDRLMDEENA